jgi:hypothetical protein
MPNGSHQGPSSTAIAAHSCAPERERPIGSTTSGSPLALNGRRPRSIAHDISHLGGRCPSPEPADNGAKSSTS